MPAAKPTLGFPSRTAAAFAMHKRGMTFEQIAVRMGIRKSSVYGLVRDARRSKIAGVNILIATDFIDALTPDADMRGVSVETLIKRIIKTVATENLVAAVLDDANSTTGHKAPKAKAL